MLGFEPGSLSWQAQTRLQPQHGLTDTIFEDFRRIRTSICYIYINFTLDGSLWSSVPIMGIVSVLKILASNLLGNKNVKGMLLFYRPIARTQGYL